MANILDNLSGSGALISVRGRATFSRPFERVEALRRQADDRLRSKALELQAELQQTETKLTDLQSKRNDQSSLVLSPEQEAELKRFVAEKAHVRKELRENTTRTGCRYQSSGILAEGRQHRHCTAPGRRGGCDHSVAAPTAQDCGIERNMNRQRFLWLLAAAALAISAALYLSTQRNLPRDAHGSALLPSLAHEMDTVTALSVRRAAKLPTVTVHQQNGQVTGR